MNHKKTIYVYADWVGLGDLPQNLGILTATVSKGKEVFYFDYNERWLESHFDHVLDPDLRLFSGPQYLNDEKPNFGIFLDSSPDRWGKLLMRRREAAAARAEARPQYALRQSDYLLGVHDEQRIGALRFKLNPEGNFLDDRHLQPAPPIARLRSLEYASLQLERSDAVDDEDYLKWLNLLVNPGSLGGARPKAGVRDEGGSLCIAKFPSAKDEVDKGAWEMVVRDLAELSGVFVSQARIAKFNSQYHTFITKRFDRTNEDKRIHFASAMTMLGYTDGTDFHDGASYLEIAEFLMRHGSNATGDLEQLWRRIVFNIGVSNTDDHLRNHGFLLSNKGWSLSPAYDMNPEHSGTGLSLNISENDNTLNYELALEVAPLFRLPNEKANEIITEIRRSISAWRDLAVKYGISRNEQELMSIAFRF
jgi:serine/threonine-protein kinase HipA